MEKNDLSLSDKVFSSQQEMMKCAVRELLVEVEVRQSCAGAAAPCAVVLLSSIFGKMQVS